MEGRPATRENTKDRHCEVCGCLLARTGMTVGEYNGKTCCALHWRETTLRKSKPAVERMICKTCGGDMIQLDHNYSDMYCPVCRAAESQVRCPDCGQRHTPDSCEICNAVEDRCPVCHCKKHHAGYLETLQVIVERALDRGVRIGGMMAPLKRKYQLKHQQERERT